VLWIELIVRSSLIYLLVAVSPLGFAAMLWPAARGFLRKTVEILVAVILAKFVICVALSVGVAALSGAGQVAEGGVGAGFGTLLVGSALLGLAAFSPFLVLKLVPAAEAALVAQGVSHAPARAAHTGAVAYSAVARLSGGGRVSSAGGTGGVTASAAAPPEPSPIARVDGARGGTGGGGMAAGAATAGIAGPSTAARRTAATADQRRQRTGGDPPAGPRHSPDPSVARDRGTGR
jgi:hypothetical protein